MREGACRPITTQLPAGSTTARQKESQTMEASPAAPTNCRPPEPFTRPQPLLATLSGHPPPMDLLNVRGCKAALFLGYRGTKIGPRAVAMRAASLQAWACELGTSWDPDSDFYCEDLEKRGRTAGAVRKQLRSQLARGRHEMLLVWNLKDWLHREDSLADLMGTCRERRVQLRSLQEPWADASSVTQVVLRDQFETRRRLEQAAIRVRARRASVSS